MHLEHLKYFVEVVYATSINKAAKNLFISRPTMTSAIKTLENELGFPIIKRSHLGVELTEKCKKVFEDVQQILAMEQGWKTLRE